MKALQIISKAKANKIQVQSLFTPIIELQQTSARAVYVAYHNREIVGEFRGYGKTEDERIESARKQAIELVKSRQQ